MGSLGAITKSELARKTCIIVATVENIAGFYSGCTKNSIISENSHPFRWTGCTYQENPAIIEC
jgi:hypothetical protein